MWKSAPENFKTWIEASTLNEVEGCVKYITWKVFDGNIYMHIPLNIYQRLGI